MTHRMVVGGLALVLALSGCGSQPKQESEGSTPIVEVSGNADTNMMNAAMPDNAANAGNSAAENAAAEEAVRAVIDAIYASYEGQGEPNAANYPLSPDFRSAWNRAVGTEGALDYDPYCACQDHGDGFSHVIRSVEVKDGRAHVTLTVKQFADAKGTALWYDLLHAPKGWLIDDMVDGEGKSLKARFKAAAPGSMAATDE